MNDVNLYQPPAPGAPAFPPQPQPLPVHKPPVIQVFGILHLLAGGYGIITGLLAIFMVFAGNPFLKLTPAGPARDAQESMTRDLAPMTNINLGITMVLVVLVIIAGIKLLRTTKDSVKMSNIYAVASILGKIANGILVFIYMVPAQRKMMEQQLGEMGGQIPSGMKTGMDMAMTGGAFIGIIFTCIYPILALILLNRRSVKEWLARFGK